MSNTALLLIDWQQGLIDPANAAHWGGGRNNPDAEDKALALLAKWRAGGAPVLHVLHHSQDPDSPLFPGKAGAEPIAGFAARDGETVFAKRVNSGFIGTELEAHLGERGIGELVVCGLTSNHCVSTTVRMAGNLGFDVTLVEDACATFDRLDVDGKTIPAAEVHRITVANLHGEFCTAVKAASLLD